MANIAGAVTLQTTLGVTGITTLGAAIVGPATATVFNTVSTTVNAFGAATTLNIGNSGGTNTVLGATAFSQASTFSAGAVIAASQALTGTVASSTISGFLSVAATNFLANTTTAGVVNTVATTVNAFGAASAALNIGHASGTNTVLGATTFSQGLQTSSTLRVVGNAAVYGSLSTSDTYVGLTDISTYGGLVANGADFVLTSNAIYNGGWKAKNTAASNIWAFNGLTTTYYTGASVTAGSAISFVERMHIDNTGMTIANALTVTGTITGTLATAAQPNITSLGTIAALVAGTISGSSTFAISGTGPHAIGSATNSSYALLIDPVGFSGTVNPRTLGVKGNFSPAAGNDGYGFETSTTINKAGSGTHANFIGAIFNPPTIGAGAATLTNAYNVYIAGAPSTGTNKFALYVASGAVQFDGALAVTGAVTLSSTVSTTGLTVSVGASNATITVGNNSAAASLIALTDYLTGTGKYAFRIGAQINADDTWEVTPSTAAGGTTFTSPALKVARTGVITIPNLAGAGTRTVVVDANGVLSAP